jgi:hypothetical protein
MNKIFYFLVLIFLLSSCSHIIVRRGYYKVISEHSNCNVFIKKQMPIPASLKKVGEIKLGESGFSITCSEEHALELLRKEACSVNATIINIVEESRPDLLSSCYRCRAEFYINTDDNITYQSDEQYNSSNVDKRVSDDRIRNTFIAIGTIGLSCVLLFLTF